MSNWHSSSICLSIYRTDGICCRDFSFLLPLNIFLMVVPAAALWLMVSQHPFHFLKKYCFSHQKCLCLFDWKLEQICSLNTTLQPFNQSFYFWCSGFESHWVCSRNEPHLPGKVSAGSGKCQNLQKYKKQSIWHLYLTPESILPSAFDV